eukprot:GGOE01028530.1.p4 GENE.GGOE01028530.1~~GGOE01028530.1.p4  ORF type:complete len:104 (-),score=7.44 GGOE01028530.1:482-793(-)
MDGHSICAFLLTAATPLLPLPEHGGSPPMPHHRIAPTGAMPSPQHIRAVQHCPETLVWGATIWGTPAVSPPSPVIRKTGTTPGPLPGFTHPATRTHTHTHMCH